MPGVMALPASTSTAESLINAESWDMVNNNTFNVAAGTVAGGVDLLVSAVIADADSITKSGAGNMVVTGVDTYTGATNITGGTLQVGNGGTTSLATSAVVLSNNAVLGVNITNAWSTGAPITGAGSVYKTGAGTLQFTGTNNNTFSGGLTVGGGTLIAGGFGATNTTEVDLGTGTITLLTGGVLELNPDVTGGTVEGNTYSTSNSITLNGGTLMQYDGFQHLTGQITVGAAGGTLLADWHDKGLYVDGTGRSPAAAT